MPIKVVIVEHMKAKFGPEKKWPTKVDMAKALKTNTPTVRSWLEERVTRVDLDTLDKWCEYLEVDTGDILVRKKK